MREESTHLTHEINVALGTLQMHYESADPTEYKLSDVLDALMTFMQRTKDTEQADLNRKYSMIHTAPLSALWTGLPSSAILPPGAMRANQQFIQPAPQITNWVFGAVGEAIGIPPTGEASGETPKDQEDDQQAEEPHKINRPNVKHQGSSRLSPEFNTIKFSHELVELQYSVQKLFDLNVDLNKFNEFFMASQIYRIIVVLLLKQWF